MTLGEAPDVTEVRPCDETEKSRLLRVRKTLRQLSRQADLRLEGLSLTQVAKAIGVSRNTVKRRQKLLRRLALKNQNTGSRT